MTDIITFTILKTGGLRHYYQPTADSMISLLNETVKKIQLIKDSEQRELLIDLAYEVGLKLIIPNLLEAKTIIPNSWHIIENLKKQKRLKKV